jgi:hypothetical protein
MTAGTTASNKRLKGRKALALGAAFVLAIMGCSQLLALAIPGAFDLYASSAWPVQSGTMTDSVERAHAYSGRWTYGVRDVFRTGVGGAERLCHWDEPVLTHVQSWIDQRLEPRAWLWPKGASVNLHVQAGGRLCSPVGGWWLAVERTTFWVRAGISACFLGALGLWLWQRRICVPGNSGQSP